MTSAPHPLVKRAEAAQATVDRFLNQPFALGKRDCAQMLLFHLRSMGHVVKLAGVGDYKTVLGGKRALRRLGFASLTEAMDSRFPRITPAAAIVGDVIALASGEALDALAIAVGNGRALGYHENAEGAVIIQPRQTDTAWRVDP
ncbi:DUF6950 family protein [Sphingomonas immobilis]|uniref:DUF6950 domain-containing protein n=1 Tax=Sphingomonas immobilis TaxID=3063997 RepID=A0ABT9A0W6_9SPHN|nr:hypothetical protein [Sphingomonas sp. CA1-15]MDO7843460.1 hypothetical protein [Sphingomonas sp. CA1-15]